MSDQINQLKVDLAERKSETDLISSSKDADFEAQMEEMRHQLKSQEEMHRAEILAMDKEISDSKRVIDELREEKRNLG